MNVSLKGIDAYKRNIEGGLLMWEINNFYFLAFKGCDSFKYDCIMCLTVRCIRRTYMQAKYNITQDRSTSDKEAHFITKVLD